MAKGGKRPGAGRQEGSMNIPKLSSFFTQAELEEYVAFLKTRYKESDKIAVFVGEHLFGKAPQPLVGSDGRELPQPIYNVFAHNSNEEGNKPQ